MPKKKILIIDNHKDFRAMIGFFIQKRFDNIEIKEAETGEEGVKMARSEKPDLILVDIRLPGMDGIETARLIKEYLPGCRVITMSMFSQASLQEFINKEIILFVNKGNIDTELLPFLNKFLEPNAV